MMNGELNRNVIITGGSSGIGRATAKAFVEQGDRVMIIGRNRARLTDTAAALGENVMWRQTDISHSGQVASAIDYAVEQFGAVDVLVNAAGFGSKFTTDTPLEEAERTWDAMHATNLKGCFLMAMAAAPHLCRPGGRLINFSSIAAFSGGSSPGSLAYAAAKAGVIGLTRALARELSPEGITANAIAPGFVPATRFFGENLSDDAVKRIVDQIPAGRPGEPADIAAAVLYLASPQASFVTGEVLHVNGGWLFGG